MIREREEKGPTVLDPEASSGGEDEPTVKDSVLKPDEAALRTLEEGAIIPEDERPAPSDQPAGRRRGAAARAETGDGGFEKKVTSEVHQLLLNAVNQNANRMNRRLKGHLTGRVQINIRGSSEAYLLDWRDEDLRVEERRDPEAECAIDISVNDLFEVARGDLNPQIGMLSDKIRVVGEGRMAIYVFNLFGSR